MGIKGTKNWNVFEALFVVAVLAGCAGNGMVEVNGDSDPSDFDDPMVGADAQTPAMQDAGTPSGATCASVQCADGTGCVDTDRGARCSDIDECAQATPVCGRDEACLNTLPGFDCVPMDSPCVLDPCGPGYDCVEAGGGRQCIDQDECAITDACPSGAECINREGATEPECRGGELVADAGVPDAEVFDAGGPTFPADGFCGQAGYDWAFCEDFDGLGTSGPTSLGLSGKMSTPIAGATGVVASMNSYHQPVGVPCNFSGVCDPYLENGTLFANAEDDGFGGFSLRVEQPVDFRDREAHIHFTTDLKTTHGRSNLGVSLKPVAWNMMHDNRLLDMGAAAIHNVPAVQFNTFAGRQHGGWIVGANLQDWRGGAIHQVHDGHGINGFPLALDDTPDEIDIYVTRTSFRVVINGAEVLLANLDALEFDRAYLYIGQLNYNPEKEKFRNFEGRGAQTLVLDNIAFDGPVIPRNTLTPVGFRDVNFRAESVADCTVKGVPAHTETGGTNGWLTWSARVPTSLGPVTESDIECPTLLWPRAQATQHLPRFGPWFYSTER